MPRGSAYGGCKSNEINYGQSQLGLNDKLNLIARRRGRNVPFFFAFRARLPTFSSHRFSLYVDFFFLFCLKLVFARHLTHLTMTPHSLGFSWLRLFLHPPRGPKSTALSTGKCLPFRPALTETLGRVKGG